MVSLIPRSAYTESVIDEARVAIPKSSIKWILHIPAQHRWVYPWPEQPEQIDDFEYPDLNELRQRFKDTGQYTEKQLDKIVEAYERLPKYKAQRNRASRSGKRS